MTTAAASLLMLAACASLYGWGVLARRLARVPPGAWTTTLGLGLAAWIFLGGVLNLARLAYPWTIDLLLLGGLALAVTGGPGWPKTRLPLGAAGVFAVLALAALTEPSLYNHHDDFEKYFAHAARMVQTGTLFGGPLNALGSETLGAQAFLQGLVAGHFPLAYLNAVDGVFCFLLALLAAAGLAEGRPKLAAGAALAVALTALIEPQYVNVSALYSTAALIACLQLISCDPRENPSPLLTGLLYAALIALKPILLLFAVLHWAATSGRLRRAAATAGFTLLFLSPWLLLFAPYYAARWTPLSDPVVVRESLDPLSFKDLPYGATFAHYTLLGASLLAAGGLAFYFQRRGEQRAAAARLAGSSAAAAAFCLITVLLLGPALADYRSMLRYVVPVLIGALPVSLVLSIGILQAEGAAAARVERLMLAVLALLALSFAPDAFERAAAARRTGSMLAYLRRWPPELTARDLEYEAPILSGAEQGRWKALQERVPAGEPIVAWTSAPFLLDFKRNPINDVNRSGLGAPWAEVPAEGYILWQYAGFAVRPPQEYAARMKGPGRREAVLTQRCASLAARLKVLAASSDILSDDGQALVMRVAASKK